MKAAVSKELLERFGNYIEERMGLCFPKERWADLERGLRRACAGLEYADVESCARHIMLSPQTKRQIEMLASHLTVGETYFFRDRKSFDILESDIFPALIGIRKKAGKYLRIWSAGCATGEEPYSIAMLLSRLIEDIGEWNITILATDINPSFLHKASLGVYGEWSFRDVLPWVRQRYFRQVERGRFEILSDIGKSVTFSYHNLAEDPCPSLLNNTNAMDLVLCRNMLMYFAPEKQMKVVGKLYHSLVNGGWLMVSPTEVSSVVSSPFLSVQFPGATLYRKDIEGARRAISVAPQAATSLPESYQAILACPASEVRRPATQPGAFPSEMRAQPDEDAASFASSAMDPYAKALRSYELGCYTDAEEKILSLLTEDIPNGPASALLSRVYANTGQLSKAREFSEKAIAADKLNPAYYYLLASILQESGQMEESEACLKRTLYLDQNFVPAHFALGNLALRQGKPGESRRQFRNALSALRSYRPDDIVPESEGITAKRMIEIIHTTVSEETLA
ncbi:MAG: CheR family methyltransferase [Thermodesulfovibrionales bacterium]